MPTGDLPMPKCTDERVEFGKVGRRVVQAAFDGGDIVSDAGVLLLQQVDERIGLRGGCCRARAPRDALASLLTH